MKIQALAILIAVLTAGCQTPTPNYDARFGDAVRDAKRKMIIHPDAGKTPDTGLGMDGRAAHDSLVRYHDSFKEPPPVVNVINIGGAIGSPGAGR